jgi:hypothetical protein
MQKLQTKFKDKVIFLLVNTYNHDDYKKVDVFLRKRKSKTGLSLGLPYSLLQTSLLGYFPHKFLPHYVWIDHTGKVITTTSQTEVNEENIQAAITGKNISLHTKKDIITFDKSHPLLANSEVVKKNNVLHQSLLLKYTEGLGNETNVIRNNEGLITRYYALNSPLISLMRTAYPEVLKYPINRIVVESSNVDTLNLFNTSDSNRYFISFCYELIMPPSTVEEFRIYVKEDLKRYFKLSARTEQRNKNCLTIIPSNIHSTGGAEEIDMEENNRSKFIKNQPLSVLANVLNAHPAFSLTPAIIEGDLNKRVDLAFPSTFYQLTKSEVTSFLRKSGFVIKEEVRSIEVAVILNN